MSTDTQIVANRRNAQLSTGPKTAEGKALSRQNGVVHGLSSDTPQAREQLKERFEACRKRLLTDHRAETPSDLWKLERVVSSALRIERCEQAIEAAIASEMQSAHGDWDSKKRDASFSLAANLSEWPEQVLNRLQSTRHGCDLLIQRWRFLADSLNRPEGWNESQHRLACDMLGIPNEARDYTNPFLPPPGMEKREYLAWFVQNQIDELSKRRDEVLVPLDELERDHAMAGLSVMQSSEMRLLLRYEREAWSKYHRNLKDLETSIEKRAELHRCLGVYSHGLVDSIAEINEKIFPDPEPRFAPPSGSTKLENLFAKYVLNAASPAVPLKSDKPIATERPQAELPNPLPTEPRNQKLRPQPTDISTFSVGRAPEPVLTS
jgi:hypothetical protein